MRKSLFVVTAFLAFAAAISAEAAALNPADYNWNGFYLGGEVGGGFGNSHRDFTTHTLTGDFGIDSVAEKSSTSGVLGGVTAGYNLQFGPAVVGLEGDISASSVNGDTTCPTTTSDCKVSNRWLGTVRPRVGYSINSILPYVTGGLAVGDIHSHGANGIAGDNFTDTKAGWTLGGGIELPFYGNWTSKLEYLYVKLSDADSTNSTSTSKVSFDENIIRLGINYKF